MYKNVEFRKLPFEIPNGKKQFYAKIINEY